MRLNDRGRLRIAVVLTVAVAAVGIIAATGFVFATDEQTGEEVFEDIQEKYNTAESVSADAVLTIDTENGTRTYESSVAATADGKTWLNVTDGDRYVTTGSDGESGWVYEPETGVTTVLTGDSEDVTATLRAGTAEPRAGIAAFEAFDANQTVGDALDEVDESSIPQEWRDVLDEVPSNTTLGELADGEYDDVLDNESAAAEEVDALRDRGSQELMSSVTIDRLLEEFDSGDAAADWNESHIDDFAGAWNESEWPESTAELRDRIQALTDQLDDTTANRDIELVGTTTVDGQEANELLITAPDRDDETRLWASVDSNEVLKVEWTGPDSTVTVDVTETRFDVSPADSTFEPPGATELARVDVTATEDADEFGTGVSFDVATPEDDWTFERGYTATVNVSDETNTTLDGDVLVAVYSDGEQSIVVTQSENARELNETVTVGDRDVRIEETDQVAVGTWSDGGTTTTVLGAFSESELRTVIESVTT
ncbi:hypothetical protein SAMN05216226_10213 [Halovenus aranensis]|uniref:Uncharacterized protein n=1 Tax=Halovenus aranensis TaxID=890420 RepID=A0A1G8SM66_9EURY|nr:hypothetical protein [Halovenus aranensis]SDJ29710.1 hypothetical protein SAMN05216226_10213 [Halovenus aranensis]